MAVSLDSYIANLTKLQSQFTPMLLNKIRGKAQELISQRMAARVQEKGVNSNGSKFSNYSTKPTLSSGRTAKSKTIWENLAGSKEKRKELQWVTINGHHLFIIKGGYKQIRQIEGLPTDKKNFTFTGEMFKSIGVKKETQDSDSTILITIKAEEGKLQERLNYVSQKEGINVIAPDKAELKIYNDFIHKCANDILNGK